MQFSQRHRRKAVINIISLVDVVFLLLIFFMVSATFMDQPGITVNMPVYSEEDTDSRKQQVEPSTIAIAPTGEIYFGGTLIRAIDIGESILRKMEKGQTQQVVIMADTLAQYGIVFEILKQLKEVGVDSISFQSTPETKQKN